MRIRVWNFGGVREYAYKIWANIMKKTPTRTVVASGFGTSPSAKDSLPGSSCGVDSLIMEPLRPTTETPSMTVMRATHLREEHLN